MLLKKFGWLVLIAAVFGCSQQSDQQRKRFVVGFDPEFPPYGYKEGSEYKGFDLDLARAVCEKKGWEFVASPVNWDAKDMELNSGAIDCIWNGFTMQGREDAYTWSCAYIANRQVVLVKSDAAIAKFKDLAGKKVAAQTDTPVLKALTGKYKSFYDVKRFGETFKEIVVEPSYNQAVNELKMGAVDAVALDIGTAKQKMKDMPGQFKMLDETIMNETYGIGFKLGNLALKDEVEDVLRELADDGTMKILAGKYGIDEDALIMWKN